MIAYGNISTRVDVENRFIFQHVFNYLRFVFQKLDHLFFRQTALFNLIDTCSVRCVLLYLHVLKDFASLLLYVEHVLNVSRNIAVTSIKSKC
jgi:hypothetical protein